MKATTITLTWKGFSPNKKTRVMEQAQTLREDVAVVKLDITAISPTTDMDGDPDDQEVISLFIQDGEVTCQEAMRQLMEKEVLKRKMGKQGGKFTMNVSVGNDPTKIKYGSEDALYYRMKRLDGFKPAAGTEIGVIKAKAVGKAKAAKQGGGLKEGSPTKRSRMGVEE